jgi:prepilin peptidase CpaA
MIWIAVTLLAIASIHDLLYREIPDWISAALFLVAAVAIVLGRHEAGWAGLLLGAGLMLAVGSILFAVGGLGGGDIKLLTALGALLGPVGLANTVFWVALAGGCLSVVALMRKQRDFAYVPAIALGLLVYGAWPGATAAVLGF